jgi:hypothetical protein
LWEVWVDEKEVVDFQVEEKEGNNCKKVFRTGL